MGCPAQQAAGHGGGPAARGGHTRCSTSCAIISHETRPPPRHATRGTAPSGAHASPCPCSPSSAVGGAGHQHAPTGRDARSEWHPPPHPTAAAGAPPSTMGTPTSSDRSAYGPRHQRTPCGIHRRTLSRRCASGQPPRRRPCASHPCRSQLARPVTRPNRLRTSSDPQHPRAQNAIATTHRRAHTHLLVTYAAASTIAGSDCDTGTQVALPLPRRRAWERRRQARQVEFLVAPAPHK